MTIEKLTQDMIQAMKNRDGERKLVLSSIVQTAKKMAIDKGCRDNISEELVMNAITKELKTVKEQLDTCPSNREDLLTKYQNAYNIINEYMPQMMTKEEIIEKLNSDFSEVITTKNKGLIMKTIMPVFKGKADGKLINEIITEICK